MNIIIFPNENFVTSCIQCLTCLFEWCVNRRRGKDLWRVTTSQNKYTRAIMQYFIFTNYIGLQGMLVSKMMVNYYKSWHPMVN